MNHSIYNLFINNSLGNIITKGGLYIYNELFYTELIKYSSFITFFEPHYLFLFVYCFVKSELIHHTKSNRKAIHINSDHSPPFYQKAAIIL